MHEFEFSIIFSVFSEDDILIIILWNSFLLNAVKRDDSIFLALNQMKCYFNVQYCWLRPRWKKREFLFHLFFICPYLSCWQETNSKVEVDLTITKKETLDRIIIAFTRRFDGWYNKKEFDYLAVHKTMKKVCFIFPSSIWLSSLIRTLQAELKREK